MKITCSFLIVSLLMLSTLLSAQKTKVLAYVSKHTAIATEEMSKTGIPASITLAQAIIESRCGRSPLAQKKHNHFGVKSGATYKRYGSAAESYSDHSKILKGNKRYASLFKLKKSDYKGWARGLYKYGYASDPQYPKKLIDTIEAYNLTKYDVL